MIDRKFYKFLSKLISQGLPPNTIKAIHVCVPPGRSIWQLHSPFFKHALGRYCRRRLLVHAGHNAELAMDLESYGIKRQHLPDDLGGKLQMEGTFAAWFEQRRTADINRKILQQGIINERRNSTLVESVQDGTASLSSKKSWRRS